MSPRRRTTLHELGLLESRQMPALTIVPNLTAIVDVTFTGAVATLNRSDLPGSPTSATAIIDWGQGPTSTVIAEATNPATPNVLVVVGEHEYTATGDFPIKVTVNSGGATLEALGALDVDPAPLLVEPTAPIVDGNGVVTELLLATFRTNGTLPLSAFEASVKFEDQPTSLRAEVTADGTGGFLVKAQRAFATPGSVRATVTITQSDGGPTNVVSTVTVVQSPLLAPLMVGPTAAVVTANGTVVDVLVATLRTKDPVPATALTASVKFDDLAVPLGANVIMDSPGVFRVVARRAFTASGTIRATVSASLNNATPLTAISTVTAVASLAPPLVPTDPTVTANGAATNVVVATFQTDGTVPLVAFTATAKFDDQAAALPAVVTSTGENGFQVTVNRAFSTPGTVRATVALSQFQGVPSTTVSTVTANPAPLTVSATAPVVPASGAVVDVLVATLRTTNLAVPATALTASVKFDDLAAPLAADVIKDMSGVFRVVVRRAFDAPGTFRAVVSVSLNNATPLTAITTVTATSAPVQLIGRALTVQAGDGPQRRTVARFTDTIGAHAGAYRAVIDLGDGRPRAARVVPNGAGFDVVARVSYRRPGTFAPVVTVVRLADDASVQVQASVASTSRATRAARVVFPAEAPFAPTLQGTVPPRSVVLLSVRREGQLVAKLQARAVADAAGNWNASLGPLAPGRYVVSQQTIVPGQAPRSSLPFGPDRPLIVA